LDLSNIILRSAIDRVELVDVPFRPWLGREPVAAQFALENFLHDGTARYGVGLGVVPLFAAEAPVVMRDIRHSV
jgi:hypothetical protein